MRNRSETQIMLVLIRHGATRANREHRYLGKTDETLSEEGKKKLLKYKESRCYPNVDCLFVSPMIRCVQTANILYPDMNPVEIPEWTEIDFGIFERKNYEELKDDKRYQVWIDSNGTLPFPDGESRGDFILRCEAGFRRMKNELLKLKKGKEVKTIGVVVHGGTIMALLSRHCGGDYFDYQVLNGEGYICMWKESDGKTEITELKKIG